MHPLKKRLRQFERQHPVLFVLSFAALVILPFILVNMGLIIYHGNVRHEYPFLYPADQIVSIQLVDIPEGIDLYCYPVDEIPGMLTDQQAVCMEIAPEKLPGFLADFAAVPCHQWITDPCPYIQNGTILITYADGAREWICSRGTFYQDCSDGGASMTWFWFEDESFAQLLKSYGFR